MFSVEHVEYSEVQRVHVVFENLRLTNIIGRKCLFTNYFQLLIDDTTFLEKNTSVMFLLRQILRLATRLNFARVPVNLHQNPSIFKSRLGVTFFERNFVRTNTNLCESPQEEKETGSKHVLGKLERKMKIMFTCKKCNYRNSKIISKLAYEKGLIIIRCDGCQNNHLIADNLGWFAEMRRTKNIEKFLLKQGEKICKVQDHQEGYIEAVMKADLELIQHNKEREKRMKEEESKTCSDKKKIGTSEET